MHQRKEIVFEPLRTFSNGIVDITDCATPRRFRWIDVASLIDGQLRIVESDQPTIGDIPYAAISYIWRGKPHVCSPDCLGTFHVFGAMDDDTDPISIDLLRTAAFAARDLGAEYLWLDRLCVMQANRDDKRWQIMNMGDVYSSCKTCLVFPGGLQRLVGVEEETDWIHRAWTLQEAVAPAKAECIFRWERVIVVATGYAGVLSIETGRSGKLPLNDMLKVAASQYMSHQYEGDTDFQKVPVKIFGSRVAARQSVSVLMYLIHFRNDEEKLENNIWRSALLRTSKHEVDMVFSIMGLFGIKLDPRRYRTRLDATIGLTQAILARGGRTNWILSSLSNTLPIPEFPNACTIGRPGHVTADGRIVEVYDALGLDSDTILAGAPGGVLEDNGTLTMVLPIARVQVTTPSDYDPNAKGKGLQPWGSVQVLDDKGDKVSESEATMCGVPGTHAAIVGGYHCMQVLATFASPTDTVLVFVECCNRDPELWHRTGVATVRRAALGDGFCEARVKFAYACCASLQ